MKLHASGEDYLEAILVLHKKTGMVRPWMSPGTWRSQSPAYAMRWRPCGTGASLTMDSDYFLHLTDVGREVAEQIYEKHRFLPTG